MYENVYAKSDGKPVRKGSLYAWVLASRPKTLSGAAVPVMIGSSLAFADSRASEDLQFGWIPMILCFLFAFLMQIDANFINDLFDYLGGKDDSRSRLGPRRACSEGWISVKSMKRAIAVTTLLACIAGLPLVLFGGIEMVVVGLFCVIFCFLYTTHLSSKGLGDLLVVMFFGVIPVCATYYIQVHSIGITVVLASIACGLVIDCLLMVNNFRDREADRISGKITLVVRLGEKNSLLLYLLLGYLAVLLGIIFLFGSHPLAFILSLLWLPLHHSAYLGIRRVMRGKALNRLLALTARNILAYGILVSLGLLL